jgi:hypothetical protein
MHHYGYLAFATFPGPHFFNSQYFHEERSSNSEMIILQGAVP